MPIETIAILIAFLKRPLKTLYEDCRLRVDSSDKLQTTRFPGTLPITSLSAKRVLYTKWAPSPVHMQKSTACETADVQWR